ncbi:DUF1631 domain-containing protein [Aestuariicella sp. G3-2]|uniref:DUF1631 family protein n=1 Tax=Pseudomaricurvus albidus TaxID=2842452 RepID=UPI001C0D422C|nr:DUF1631 family protein [Aestuariicella albida]MBU3070280.1 DUF1631 domain-containing protein [Aestuariicella albida]
MTTTALPIAQILKGHGQSLHQALRMLSEHQPPTTSDTTISPAALMADIETLADKPEADSNDSPDGQVNKKLILRTHIQRLNPSAQLTRDVQPALIFVDLFISELTAQTKPHSSITHLCRKTSLMIGCLLLTRPDIAITADHPFCRLIQKLYQQLTLWEPAAGRQGKAFSEWLHKLCQELPVLDINSSQEMDGYSKQLQAIIESDLERSQKVEQRLLEAASGSNALETARKTVIEFIGRRLSQRELPEDVALFIQNTLISDLQYLLIHEGIECELWKKWKRLLQIFSWAFLSDSSESHRTKVATLLPPMIEKLDESYWQGLPKAEQYPDFISAIQHYFLQAMTGTPIVTKPFPDLLPTSAEAPQKAMLSQNIEHDLSHIKEGDWFLFRQDSKEYLKGKLLYKSPKLNTLLMTKYSGQKLADYSFDDFSVGLAAKNILPLKTHQLYALALNSTLQRLDNHYQKNLQAEKHREILMARQQAALKAEKEAQVLHQQAENLPEISDNLRSSLQQQIAQLNVGAWLKWQRTETQTVEIKLSVKLQNSDKYIFTDRLGQRIADYSLTQLVELMAQKQITILSQGENFESSLEKVVRGLRKP